MAVSTRRILLLPGDGIGPEVMDAGPPRDRLARAAQLAFAAEEALVGGASLDAHGTPLTERRSRRRWRPTPCCSAPSAARSWDKLPFHHQARAGPAAAAQGAWACSPTCARRCASPALADASSLKRELVEGLDIMILRELTGGVYFGEPRGIETLPDGSKRGVDTQVYTTPRDRADRPRRLRARAQAPQQGHLGREGQRHAHRRALARDRARRCTSRVSRTSSSATCTPTTAPCSWCASPSSSTSSSPTTCSATAVRLCRDADRLARHAALGLARCGRCRRPAQGALRAGPRLAPPTSPARASPIRSPCCSASR